MKVQYYPTILLLRLIEKMKQLINKRIPIVGKSWAISFELDDFETK